MTYKKYKGFTLAEVLITLGIIGIIASLTIPTLVQNADDAQTITAVKNEYALIQQAISNAETDDGKIYEWYTGTDISAAINLVYSQILPKYLKVTQNCGRLGTGCFPTTPYKYLSNNYSGSYDLSTGGMQLADGSMISLGLVMGSNYIRQLIFYVDINGQKGPNRFGYDIFEFYVNSYPYEHQFNQILLPYSTNPAVTLTNSNTNCDNTASDISGMGSGCATWIIYKNTVDYKYGKALTYP